MAETILHPSLKLYKNITLSSYVFCSCAVNENQPIVIIHMVNTFLLIFFNLLVNICK